MVSEASYGVIFIATSTVTQILTSGSVTVSNEQRSNEASSGKASIVTALHRSASSVVSYIVSMTESRNATTSGIRNTAHIVPTGFTTANEQRTTTTSVLFNKTATLARNSTAVQSSSSSLPITVPINITTFASGNCTGNGNIYAYPVTTYGISIPGFMQSYIISRSLEVDERLGFASIGTSTVSDNTTIVNMCSNFDTSATPVIRAGTCRQLPDIMSCWRL